VVLEVFRLLFEFSDTHDVSLDFVLHNAHSGVTNLVGEKDFLEVREVGVGLE
jgi:hypothetical protein